MNLKIVRDKLVGSEEQRAVSPVIGVILMVAITVILAAVIAAFVMDIGDMGESPPNANFQWDQSGSTEVEITHSGGDPIDSSQITISPGSASSWPSSEITAGDSVTVTGLNSGDEVQIIWETDEGNSQILDSYEMN